MAENTDNGGGRRGNRWSLAIWGTAALMLLLPLLAMQLTDQWNWDLPDFVLFGAMLVGACGAYELATRITRNKMYRAAVGVAVGAAFILVWINGAVGIIGSEDNPANLMYFGVLTVGIIGALIARFRPDGMARALLATAITQTSVAVIAIIGGLGEPYNGPLQLALLNGFFVVLFAASAWLFRRAASGGSQAGAA